MSSDGRPIDSEWHEDDWSDAAGQVAPVLCQHGDPIDECHELLVRHPKYKAISVEPPQTESGEHILEVLVPRWAEHFVAKNGDYGDQHRYALGPKAEWVGVDRKITKLEEAIWNEKQMNGEGVQEMLHDLIGQCFLILDLLDGNWEPRSRSARKSP